MDDVLVIASADSVGTKVLLASLLGDHRGIGADLVNHCVNDILACGATPTLLPRLLCDTATVANDLAQIIDGMTEACLAARCALIGGETAQLPGIYQARCVRFGWIHCRPVEENKIIDGSSIHEGDVVIGLPKHGLHTNGFTLARTALSLNGRERSRRSNVCAARLGQRPVDRRSAHDTASIISPGCRATS